MDARRGISDEFEIQKWNDLIESFSKCESEFLTQVRKVQMDDSMQNKLDEINPLFNRELTSILSNFIKNPMLDELKNLKDRMQLLKSIVTAGFFRKGNEELIKRASKQIKRAYVKALENKVSVLQIVSDASKSKLNEKDNVIAWLQSVLNRYESNLQNQPEVSLAKNPSSMWNASVNVSTDEMPTVSLSLQSKVKLS